MSWLLKEYVNQARWMAEVFDIDIEQEVRNKMKIIFDRGWRE